MRRILKRGPHAFERQLTSAGAGGRALRRRGRDLQARDGAGLPDGEDVTYYVHDGFTDLCRGPHLQTTAPIKAFKLTSLAGAYWRGDCGQRRCSRASTARPSSRRPSSTRTWSSIEQARLRDHRRLGVQLDLFHFSEVSPGIAVLASDGRGDLERADGALARAERARRATARCARRSCRTWTSGSRSGHWDHYREHMYLQRGRRAASSASSR